MKPLVIAFMLGMLAVGGAAYYFGLFNNSIEYTNKPEDKIINCSVECIEDADVKAAAEAVIKKKRLESELESLNVELTEENARHDAKSDELSSQIIEIEKELGTY